VSFLLTIAAALGVAFILGLIAQRVRLSPIVGYLLAGVLLGPYTPGFVADQRLAGQMAELGVILLMFGVGLRFRLADLWQVRRIALPGALIQSSLATLLTSIIAVGLGWSVGSGLVLGVALSVSSTVVMTRVLTDADQLDGPAGHLAVGWTVMEDLITVLVLVLLPALAVMSSEQAVLPVLGSIGLALGKVALLFGLVLAVGSRVVPWLLLTVARTRSSELFTLCVLVVALSIATAATGFFGVSLALGAFLAGIAVGRSRLSVQAAADALPLRDAFAVLFFVSIGMLLDARTVLDNLELSLALIGIVLFVKPLCALLLSLLFGVSLSTALTVALCLGQIGEFSFILAELARSIGLIGGQGYSAVVAAALVSIALNPFWLRAAPTLEGLVRRWPGLSAALDRRAEARARRMLPVHVAEKSTAPVIIVGYGPVGRTVHRIVKDFGIGAVIVERNPDTVSELLSAGVTAVYGDAARQEILLAAGINHARYLVVTLPDALARIAVIALARTHSERIEIITRARYLQERVILEETGADCVVYEEAEAAVALAEAMLRRMGSEPAAMEAEAARIRADLAGVPPPARELDKSEGRS
jgi:CPA2 family monovalent cation:H+ antiporter-2